MLPLQKNKSLAQFLRASNFVLLQDITGWGGDGECLLVLPAEGGHDLVARFESAAEAKWALESAAEAWCRIMEKEAKRYPSPDQMIREVGLFMESQKVHKGRVVLNQLSRRMFFRTFTGEWKFLK